MPRPKKLRCPDFIVEAIRQNRANRTNLKLGTAAGKQLRIIYEIVREQYNDRAFRRALSKLMRNGVITVVAETGKVPTTHQRIMHFTYHPKLLTKIPASAPLRRGYWSFDAKGKYVEGLGEGRVTCMRDIIMYVTADGLPATAAQTVARSEATKAKKVTASLVQ